MAPQTAELPPPGAGRAGTADFAVPYVVSGAAWALVAATAAVLIALELTLGISLGAAWLGVGRLTAVLRMTALLGAVSLPLAAYLLRALPAAADDQAASKWSRWGLISWNGGLAVGVVGVLAGFMSAAAWPPAPAPAVALVLLGAAMWSVALWIAASSCRPRPPVAAWFGLAAAVGLIVYLSLGLLATSGAAGPGQALAAALTGRGLAGVWAITAAMGVGSAMFPTSAGRPLYGRRAVVLGLWAWLLLQALSAPRDLAPELLPSWLVAPTATATALTALAAVAVAVALFGTFVGRTGTDAPRGGPAEFVAAGLLVVVAQVVAQAAMVPAAHRIAQFTAWDPDTGLIAAFSSLTLVAIGAGYEILPPRAGDRRGVSMRAHLYVAVGATLLLLLPLWAVSLAEAALGPSAQMLQMRMVATAPGIILLFASAAVWMFNSVLAARGGTPAAPVTRIAAVGPGPSAPAIVGTAATLFVAALFLTLFLPLVDSSYVGESDRAAARYLEPGRLPEQGRSRYVADGCTACHTQRVRPYPEDVIYGPVSQMGDYTYGPPLVGVRRAGPDLAWIGDRRPGRGSMTDALASHGPGGTPAMPWLIGAGGAVTREGAPVVDYLVRLASGFGAQPVKVDP